MTNILYEAGWMVKRCKTGTVSTFAQQNYGLFCSSQSESAHCPRFTFYPRTLFSAERDHCLDLSRSPCRNVAGQQCDSAKTECHSTESHGICRCYAEKQRGQESG